MAYIESSVSRNNNVSYSNSNSNNMNTCELLKEWSKVKESIHSEGKRIQHVLETVESMENKLNVLPEQLHHIIEERNRIYEQLQFANKKLESVKSTLQRYVKVEDPVIASDGFTYEREVLQKYFDDCKAKNTKALTRNHTEFTDDLIRNISLAELVNALKDIAPVQLPELRSYPEIVAVPMSICAESEIANNVNGTKGNNKISNNTTATTFTANNNGQSVINNHHALSDKVTLTAPNPICELNNNTPFMNYSNMANVNTNVINNDNGNSNNMFGLSNLNALNTNTAANNNNSINNSFNGSNMVTPKLIGMQGKNNDAGLSTNGIYMKDKSISNSIIPTDNFGRQLHPCIRVYGSCNFRDDCRFACYPFNACLNHIKGKCHHGNNCKELHVDPTAPEYQNTKCSMPDPRLSRPKVTGMDQDNLNNGNNMMLFNNNNTNNNNNNSNSYNSFNSYSQQNISTSNNNNNNTNTSSPSVDNSNYIVSANNNNQFMLNYNANMGSVGNTNTITNNNNNNAMNVNGNNSNNYPSFTSSNAYSSNTGGRGDNANPNMFINTVDSSTNNKINTINRNNITNTNNISGAEQNGNNAISMVEFYQANNNNEHYLHTVNIDGNKKQNDEEVTTIVYSGVENKHNNESVVNSTNYATLSAID